MGAMPLRMVVIWWCLLLLAVPAGAQQVRLRILGSMQDGGLPHAGCSCERCETSAHGDAPVRHVASLALIVKSVRQRATPEPGGHADGGANDDDIPRVYLFDATPDIRAQLRMLRDVRPGVDRGVDRKPLDGIFLTHAHMGHYLGLAHLGYEALHTQMTPVWCTPKMAAFLRHNAPWSQLVELHEIELREVGIGDRIELGGVVVRSVRVPHRDEFSDTVAYEIEGGGRRVLYMPDCDPWHRWSPRARSLIERADVAILDATFFSADELPGRNVEKIGHPLVVDTVAMLGERVRRGELRVVLTHMNHTNPLVEETNEAHRRVIEAGFEVAREGMEIVLDGGGEAEERSP